MEYKGRDPSTYSDQQALMFHGPLIPTIEVKSSNEMAEMTET